MLLCSASIASAESFQLGDQGTDVAEIQGQLSSFGYDVVADGDFGPATAEAVKDFQASQGLAVDRSPRDLGLHAVHWGSVFLWRHNAFRL